MGIRFDCEGSVIVTNKDNNVFPMEFIEKFAMENEMSYMYRPDGLFQFSCYIPYGGVEKIKDFIKGNSETIQKGEIIFSCRDEDGSLERPFPFFIMCEIVNGKYFEETLHTRLCFDWKVFLTDQEWFQRTQKAINTPKPQRKDDDLPF